MRVTEKPPWHNAFQWTGAEDIGDVEAFFSGNEGLALGIPVSASVDGDTLVVDWGAPVGALLVPLWSWVVGNPGWGSVGATGFQQIYTDAEFQDRFAELT